MTEGPVVVDAAAAADPERLLIVARLDVPSQTPPARYVLVRYAEDEPLRLLEAEPGGRFDEPNVVVAEALRMRLGLEPSAQALLGEVRWPRRASRRREGVVDVGWERAAAVTVTGEAEARLPLAGVEALPLAEAEAALATTLERELLREGAGLLGGGGAA